ncbi:MAG: hypothetical protein F6K42_14210 [Leptolyngbya sp. SIO1D8]|nr:hypothetical protein [Leptolyngbya sp. SIO1D8]
MSAPQRLEGNWNAVVKWAVGIKCKISELPESVPMPAPLRITLTEEEDRTWQAQTVA